MYIPLGCVTFPDAAVEFDAQTDLLGVDAVGHDANPSGDNWRINVSQLGAVRVRVTLKHLQHATVRHSIRTAKLKYILCRIFVLKVV